MPYADDDFEIREKLKGLSTDELINKLSSESEAVRFTAARILQIGGEENAFDASKMLLATNSAQNREVGAFLLGQLGTPHFPYSDQSLPLLLKAIDDEVAYVRAAAIASLGHLEAIVNNNILVNLLVDKSSDVRRELAFALSKLKTDIASELLIQLAKDEDEEVKDWAVFSVRKLNADGRLQFKDNIIRVLSEFDTNLPQQLYEDTLCALAELGYEGVVQDILVELENDDVSIEVIDASRKLNDPRINKALKDFDD